MFDVTTSVEIARPVRDVFAFVARPSALLALCAISVVAGTARGAFTLIQATTVTDRWGTASYGARTGVLSGGVHLAAATAHGLGHSPPRRSAGTSRRSFSRPRVQSLPRLCPEWALPASARRHYVRRPGSRIVSLLRPTS
jgi:hypothetical protein